jgi:hypothetical protein
VDVKTKEWLSYGLIMLLATIARAQQPQTSTAPIYSANAKYTQGVGPGYWPTAGSGLTLNLTAGTAWCNGAIVTYAGGTLTMTASSTNRVYLNTSSSCAPAVKTTAFTSADIPIATVTTTSSITAITDQRTMFFRGGTTPSLDQIADPAADKTFDMGGHQLNFNWTSGDINGSAFQFDTNPGDGFIINTASDVGPYSYGLTATALLSTGSSTDQVVGFQSSAEYGGTNDGAMAVSALIGRAKIDHVVPDSTAIGLFIANQPSGTATNTWAIKTGSGLVEFGDNLKIDTLAGEGSRCVHTDADGLLSAASADCGTSAGTVTSVDLSVPSWLSVSGNPITSSGTLAVSAATGQTSHRVLGTFGGSSVTLGALTGADLPNPGASTLGGVESLAAASHKWINTISTSGVPAATQPDFSDLSSSLACSQTPALTGDTTTSAGSCATTTAKVNGVAYSSGPSTHQVPVVTASNTATYKTVPDCTDTGGNHLNYTQSSDAFSCGTSGSGGGSAVPLTYLYPNDTTTGTTLNKLAKRNGSNGAGDKILVAGTSDNTYSSAIAGIVTAGAGTSGNATIAYAGPASCVFDGAITQGDYFQVSTTTAGDCHDSGRGYPDYASFPSIRYLGRITDATNGSAGTYTVDLEPWPPPNEYAGNAGLGYLPTFAVYGNASPFPFYSNLSQEGIASNSPISLFGGAPLRIRSGNTYFDLKLTSLGQSGKDAAIDVTPSGGGSVANKLRIGNLTSNEGGAIYFPPWDDGNQNGSFTYRSVDGNFYKATLTGNATLTNPLQNDAGQPIFLRFCQDATGGRTLNVTGSMFKGLSVMPAAASTCVTQLMLDIDGGTNLQAVAPAMPISATATAQTSAISDTTLATPKADALFRFSGQVDCTTSSAAATATLNLKWTDTSNTAQTLSVTATCTTLGAASLADMVHAIRAKASTAITYGVTIANTPTYDVDVRLETL